MLVVLITISKDWDDKVTGYRTLVLNKNDQGVFERVGYHELWSEKDHDWKAAVKDVGQDEIVII